jgi:hypothetical protein
MVDPSVARRNAARAYRRIVYLRWRGASRDCRARARSEGLERTDLLACVA